MAGPRWFGTYVRYSNTDKSSGRMLLSADCLVGDTLEATQELVGGTARMALNNRFGHLVGHLDAQGTELVQLYRARGWRVRLLLASIYYSEDPKPGRYWGEVVLAAYPEAESECFDVFVGELARMLASGVRPEVDLGTQAVERVREAGGKWRPSGRVPALKGEDGVLMKDGVSTNERLIELARDRNPGCMAAGWVFIALLVVASIFLLKWLLGL